MRKKTYRKSLYITWCSLGGWWPDSCGEDSEICARKRRATMLRGDMYGFEIKLVFEVCGEFNVVFLEEMGLDQLMLFLSVNIFFLNLQWWYVSLKVFLFSFERFFCSEMDAFCKEVIKSTIYNQRGNKYIALILISLRFLIYSPQTNKKAPHMYILNFSITN